VKSVKVLQRGKSSGKYEKKQIGKQGGEKELIIRGGKKRAKRGGAKTGKSHRHGHEKTVAYRKGRKSQTPRGKVEAELVKHGERQ